MLLHVGVPTGMCFGICHAGVEDHHSAPQPQAAQQQAAQSDTDDSFDLLNSPSQLTAASSATVSPSRGAPSRGASSSAPARQPVSPAPQPASRGQSPSSRPSAAAESSPARTARRAAAAAPAPDQAVQERAQPMHASSGGDSSASRERRPADRRPPLRDTSPDPRLSKPAARWQVGLLFHSVTLSQPAIKTCLAVCLHDDPAGAARGHACVCLEELPT